MTRPSPPPSSRCWRRRPGSRSDRAPSYRDSLRRGGCGADAGDAAGVRPVVCSGGARARGQRAGSVRGRGSAALRGLPDPVGRRLAVRDGQPDARDRARALGCRRKPGPGPPVLRRALRRLDPAGAAATGLHPVGMAGPVRGGAGRRHHRRRAREPLDAAGAPNPAAGRSRHARANPARARARGMTLGVVVVLAVIGLPALVFVLWPLRARAGAPAALLPLPPDEREQLEESKRAALRALRELEFEHASGHVGDADYADLRARYEAEAAQILSELDRLAPSAPTVAPAPPTAERLVRRAGWRHPAALTVAAVALVTFGVALGVGIVRFTEPETSMASAPGGGG